MITTCEKTGDQADLNGMKKGTHWKWDLLISESKKHIYESQQSCKNIINLK